MHVYMCSRFSNDRKYETGQYQKYKTLHDNVDVDIPRSANPNALEANGPQVECLVSPDPEDAEVEF